MKIYTKTGDRGKTSLFGGKRIPKSHIQVEAYGTIDELTSFIGWICASKITPEDEKILTYIQADLYSVMAHLSGSNNTSTDILEKRIEVFEQSIDQLDSTLPKLTQFVLPQGTEESSRFHIARSVCRRAERSVVSLFSSKGFKDMHKKKQGIIIQYLNRLSDLFFVLSRAYTPDDLVVYTK